jgi:hypothetical protein
MDTVSTIQRRGTLVGFVLTAVLLVGAIRVLSRPVEATQVPVGAPRADEALLRAQLELIQHHQDQVMALVGTSLQVAVMIALGLAAFGWFSAQRNYQRDSDALRAEVVRRAVEAESRLATTLRGQADESKDVAVKAVQAAVLGATANLKNELGALSYDLWWGRFLFHQAQASRYEGKFEYNLHQAFQAHLDSLDVVVTHFQYSDTGFHSQELDALAGVMTKGYRPGSHQIERLQALFPHMSANLKPLIDRLNNAISKA